MHVLTCCRFAYELPFIFHPHHRYNLIGCQLIYRELFFWQNIKSYYTPTISLCFLMMNMPTKAFQMPKNRFIRFFSSHHSFFRSMFFLNVFNVCFSPLLYKYKWLWGNLRILHPQFDVNSNEQSFFKATIYFTHKGISFSSVIFRFLDNMYAMWKHIKLFTRKIIRILAE